jgi:hypothetical protein
MGLALWTLVGNSWTTWCVFLCLATIGGLRSDREENFARAVSKVCGIYGPRASSAPPSGILDLAPSLEEGVLVVREVHSTGPYIAPREGTAFEDELVENTPDERPVFARGGIIMQHPASVWVRELVKCQLDLKNLARLEQPTMGFVMSLQNGRETICRLVLMTSCTSHGGCVEFFT